VRGKNISADQKSDDAVPSPGPATGLRAGVGRLAPQAAPAVSFEDLYRVESRRVLAVVLALTGDWGAAEDVVQESFAEAYCRWDTVRRLDRPGAWIRRVAINRAISRARRRAVEQRVLSQLGLRAESVDDPVPDADLWAAVRRLPRRQAQVVALTYIENLTMAEVAGVIDCGEGSVKKHLSRARQRLARELPDHDPTAGGARD
jgi:RNA polymerase sigma-70 factor (ECF subfamily)